jgi:hypothetical protein
MASAGPVIAYRTNHRALALGFDVSATGFGVGVHGGGTFGMSTSAPTGGFVAARAVVPLARSGAFKDPDEAGVGLSLGWGSAAGQGDLMVGVWPQYMHGDFTDCHGARVYTIQLGYRRISSESEVFLSPQIGTFQAICFD